MYMYIYVYICMFTELKETIISKNKLSMFVMTFFNIQLYIVASVFQEIKEVKNTVWSKIIKRTLVPRVLYERNRGTKCTQAFFCAFIHIKKRENSWKEIDYSTEKSSMKLGKNNSFITTYS